ncbi:MAG: ribonuclease P protein component [Candidatus Pacebacteria bacterium]|jgi:ribonuclease P protein component|nr:ribonuclease P protein component [Candidatus Paceibacterota bacterium]
MLPRKNRISRKEFPSQNVKGFPLSQKRVSDVDKKLFTAVFYKKGGKESEISRVSVVVSKKTAKTAVDRNTLRRRFYDLVAPILKQIEGSTTVVIYPKIEAKKETFQNLKAEMEKAFKTANLLK